MSLVTLAGCAACSGQAPAGAVEGRVTPTYGQGTGKLQKLAYDRNGDGREDAWVHMDGTRLLDAALDEDFDGVVDRRELYAAGGSGNRAGGTPAIRGDGVLNRVERLAASGAVVRTETYVHGTLAEAEEDADGDGRIDKWERYEGGALASVALDTQGSGRPDRRIVYGRDGEAPRVETDPDGRGQFRSANSGH